MAKSKITKLTIVSEMDVYQSVTDMTKKEAELISLAKQSIKNAYAPYSQFFVGAAILLDNGKIITGNNQENAAYPSGLCAERVALFYASSQYPGISVKSIAIAVKSKKMVINEPLSPCGSCRQVIAEYEKLHQKPIKIIMTGEKGPIYVANSIESILPLMFSKKYL